MTYNYNRPPLHPETLPDKPWTTADGGYINPLFIEDSYATNDDSHFQMNAHYESRTMSDADYALASELGGDVSQWVVGWTIGPEGRPIAVFGQGRPRESQPVPVKFVAHLTAKVIKRATKDRRLWYKGRSLKERWSGVLYHPSEWTSTHEQTTEEADARGHAAVAEQARFHAAEDRKRTRTDCGHARPR